MMLFIFLSCTANRIETKQCESDAQCSSYFPGSLCNLDETSEKAVGYCQFCETHSDCRGSDGYGTGYVCEQTVNTDLPEGKYCEPMTEPERCTAEPQDIWTKWDEYQDYYLIGELFDYSSDQEKIESSYMAFVEIEENYDEIGFIQISCDYANDDIGEIDGLTEDEAVVEATSILHDQLGINLIVGPAGSSDTKNAYDIVGGDAVIISPSATAPSLTEHDTTGTLWRTVGPDTVQASVLTKMILVPEEFSTTFTQQISSVGVLYQESDYGTELSASLETTIATTSHNNVQVYLEDFEVGSSDDIESGWSNLLNNNIEAVIFISSDVQDSIEFVKLFGQSINDRDYLRLFLTDSAKKESFLDDLQNLFEQNSELVTEGRILGTSPAVISSDENFIAFTEVLDDANLAVDPLQDVYAAYSYDTSLLAMLSVSYASQMNNGDLTSITASNLSDAIRNTTMNSNDESATLIDLRPDNWDDIVDAIKNNELIDIAGASGNLNYDEQTEELKSHTEVWKISPISSPNSETQEFIFEPNKICFGQGLCCNAEDAPCEDCSSPTIDLDQDGDKGCDDSECEYSSYCFEHSCSDEEDNDNDFYTDCSDPDCFNSEECTSSSGEICGNGIDDDFDSYIDCGDPDCMMAPSCSGETDCYDGIDNDGDGMVDCADYECENDPYCLGSACFSDYDLGSIVGDYVATNNFYDSYDDNFSASCNSFGFGGYDFIYTWEAPYTGCFEFSTESMISTVLSLNSACPDHYGSYELQDIFGYEQCGNNIALRHYLSTGEQIYIGVDYFTSAWPESFWMFYLNIYDTGFSSSNCY
jgi:ABC-type branched-subunit amino acid transport system substrate-binding protein